MSRNTQYCDRCSPNVFSDAMGYIPLPEMTNIGDTRVDERRILLCRYHYFEAKNNCYYVVPFDRDDDPVDDFLPRVKKRHKLIRGTHKLSFNGNPKRVEELPPPDISLLHPKQQSNRKVPERKGSKVHLSDGTQTTCGLPIASTDSSTEIEWVTCKNCITISNRKALEQEPINV